MISFPYGESQLSETGDRYRIKPFLKYKHLHSHYLRDKNE